MQSYLNREPQLRRSNALDVPQHPQVLQPARSSEPIRFGLIVPSSNVTMEWELPAMYARREVAEPERSMY
jgi:hypothetical protein